MGSRSQQCRHEGQALGGQAGGAQGEVSPALFFDTLSITGLSSSHSHTSFVSMSARISYYSWNS